MVDPAGGDPLRASTSAARLKPSYPFQFELLDKATPFKIIDVEILICGSGAGGGVVASELSKAHKVLVIDKGPYIAAEDLAGTPAAGFRDLYGEWIDRRCSGSTDVLIRKRRIDGIGIWID